MKTNLKTILLSVMVMIFFSGCAKYPETEVQSTKAGVEKARAAGAEMYVNQEYQVLQDSLENLLLVIENEKSKWFPDYSEAIAQLTVINTLSEQVTSNTESKKIEIRTEIQNTLTQIQALLVENNQLIAEAPKGKEGAEALTQIQEDLSEIQTTVDEAGKMLDGEELIPTREMVTSANQKAMAINTELKDAIAKYSQAKGRRG